MGRSLVHIVLLINGASAAVDPCAPPTTGAPAPPPPPAPPAPAVASPCTTATPAPKTTPAPTFTTTPAPTCAGFTCPADEKLRPQPAMLTCVGKCTSQTCCLVIPTTVTTTPAPTFTTTPAVTCAGFTCPSDEKLRPQPEKLVCAGSKCTSQTCCLIIPTTVTTTPAPTFTTTPVPTCSSFTCPSGTSIKPLANHIACIGGKCTSSKCCNLIITTVTTTPAPTFTTTPVPTCAHFTCPSDQLLRPQPAALTCVGKCTSKTCCLLVPTTVTTTPAPTYTTTPATTVTTTPAPTTTPLPSPCTTAAAAKPKPTCAGYVCPAGMTLRPQPEKLDCASDSFSIATGCSAQTCCLTPATAAPTPAPTPVPSNPCTTAMPSARLFSAQKNIAGAEPNAASQSWSSVAMPLFGAFTLLACVSVVAVSRTRRASRSTREVSAFANSFGSDSEGFLEDGLE